MRPHLAVLVDTCECVGEHSDDKVEQKNAHGCHVGVVAEEDHQVVLHIEPREVLHVQHREEHLVRGRPEG